MPLYIAPDALEMDTPSHKGKDDTMTTDDTPPADDSLAQADHDPTGPALIVLMGIAGVGKSSWAAARYPYEQVSSADQMRLLVSDSEANQYASSEAWSLLMELVKKRCELGRRAIIDATHVKREERVRWIELARERGLPTQLVWFDISVEESLTRQSERARKVSEGVLKRQLEHLQKGDGEALTSLKQEGWDRILRVSMDCKPGEAEVLHHTAPPVYRELPSHGARIDTPDGYDVIGDVHGCFEELCLLLEELGWQRETHEDDAQETSSGEPLTTTTRSTHLYRAPADKPERKVVFVGDLTDRGPMSVPVVELVYAMWKRGRAYLVRGNHDDKLLRYLHGNKITLDDHLATTASEIDALSEEEREHFTRRAVELIDASPYWAFLGQTALSNRQTFAPAVVAHAAWKPRLMFAKKDMVKWFCLYGPSTGKKDEHGYPERLDWRVHYPEHAPVCITGHTPFSGEPTWHEQTLCIDTACVFGHRLTALRWPERELVSQQALHEYSGHAKGIEAHPKLVLPDR